MQKLEKKTRYPLIARNKINPTIPQPPAPPPAPEGHRLGNCVYVFSRPIEKNYGRVKSPRTEITLLLAHWHIRLCAVFVNNCQSTTRIYSDEPNKHVRRGGLGKLGARGVRVSFFVIIILLF